MKITKYLPEGAVIAIRYILHKINRYRNAIYAQKGEDVILERIINIEAGKMKGFYIDIGAHHPSRFSNTFFFYKRGWNGINIDAQPGVMRLFNAVRPRDINLEMCVSNKHETLEFHIFGEPGLNSADPDTAQRRKKDISDNSGFIKTVKVRADTLKAILDTHCPDKQHIDFMSIDVEGMDLKVLQSNDWTKYRPDHILIEQLGETYYSLSNSEIAIYLEQVGYLPFSKLVHTVIYRKKDMAPLQYF